MRKGRLVESDTRQLDSERRRDRALVRATLRAERDTGRGARKDHLRADVEAIDQGIETAADEWVVDRTDRNQVLAGQFVREPELAERHEEVHLRNAELDVLPARTRQPIEHLLARILVVARLLLRED